MKDAPPQVRYELAVIAASAGGIRAMCQIAEALPASLRMALAVVIHRRDRPGPDLLVRVVQRCTALHVSDAREGDTIADGHIYIAPAGAHLVVRPDRTFGLSTEAKVRHSRPAADVLFYSAAPIFGERLVAIVLTGGDSDGADGVAMVKRHGGLTIAQHPKTAEIQSMPCAAIESRTVDKVLALEEIGPTLVRLAGS